LLLRRTNPRPRLGPVCPATSWADRWGARSRVCGRTTRGETAGIPRPQRVWPSGAARPSWAARG